MLESSNAKLLSAVMFAADKHRDQRRKDCERTPYINHPIEVAHLLMTIGGIGDIDVLIAALLHDTVEDTETTLDEVETCFGLRVRKIVAEVTDDKSLPKTRRKELQVETAPHKSSEAKLVKLGDKISNISRITLDCPSDWELSRKVAYVDWGAQVIEGCRGVNAELERKFDEVAAQAKARLKS